MYKIIGVDQKEYGPITADQLRQWISEGRINGATRVQAEGQGTWKTVAELPEFAGALSIMPRPVPSVPIFIPAPAPPKTNQMALWAMITGIISVLCCCYYIGPLPIVLGFISQSQIKKDPSQGGSGFAIAGIILGIIAVILSIVGTLVWAFSPNSIPNLQNLLKQ